MTPLPPFTPCDRLQAQMRQQGYAVLDPQCVCRLVDRPLEQLLALGSSWNDLPPDKYLKDGGHYRRRRHSCFVLNGNAITQAPHRAHWQPVEYNALHGGMQRWFEPLEAACVEDPALRRCVAALAEVAIRVRPA